VTSDVGPGGILLVAADSRDPRMSPLVLVVDVDGVGGFNPGASATNAMGTIVSDWRETVAEVLGRTAAELAWVQLDSEGSFDNVRPGPGDGLSVEWTPVTAPGCAPRSVRAFRAAYPCVSDVVFRSVAEMSGVDLREAAPAAWGTA